MVSFAGSSSTTPSSDGAVQGMADHTETPTFWYGGENADQDVCIRLVDDGRTLAYLMVHSSRLESSSSYFAAALSERWTSKRKRSPHELTFHVYGDVRLYTDCFSRMYNPFKVGFKTVEYGLQLLAAATHLACDDLMSSICLYLASISQWSCADEMRIRSSVLSEDFPRGRGHAQDLLERLEGRLTRDDLRPLITRCMQLASASSERSGREAKELLIHLLTTARVQPHSPIPTFEQVVLSVINEEFKLVLIQADNEIGSTYTEAGARDMVRRLEVIRHVLDMLVAAGVADEAVTGFVCYDACLRRLRATALDSISIDVACFKTNGTWKVAYAYAGTVLTILEKVMHGSLFVRDRDLSVLLMKWLPILEWVYQESNIDVGGVSIDDFCKWYEEVKEVIVPKSLSQSEQGLLLLVYKEENLYDSEDDI